MRAQHVAACQHGEVLQHDGVEERGHQLVGRRPLLLQTVDVSLGEHAALAGYLMQLDPSVSLMAKLLWWNPKFGVDLVDDRAGAAGALVVHRRDLLLAAGLLVFLEDDDLGVLSTKFHHRVHLRVKLLNG